MKHMPEFDVLDHDDGVELLPDFFTGELDREEKKLYRKLRKKCDTESGGIIIQGGNFEPGGRVSLDEVVEEELEADYSSLYDKLRNQMSPGI